MAKSRAKDFAPSGQAHEDRAAPVVDPLRLLWSLTALTLAIILAYSHAYPRDTYPSHGIIPSLGLIVLAAAGVLVLMRAPWVGWRTLAPALLPCLLVLWAWWRTSQARVPSEGVGLLGTLLESCLVFAIALILATVGKHFRSLRLAEPTTGEATGAPGGTHGTTRNPNSKAPNAASSAPRPFLDAVLAFFLVLATGAALWAIYQHFVLYDQQYMDLLRSLRDRGMSDFEIPPKQWALLELLRSKRIGARFGNPNVLAGFLAMVAPLAIGGAWIWRDRSSKAVAWGVLGLLVYVVLLTGSRGGMLTLLCAIVAAVAVVSWKTCRRCTVWLGLTASVCLLAALLAFASMRGSNGTAPTASREAAPRPRHSFLDRVLGTPTVAQRFYYWQSAWPMIRQAPLLGHGLGAYGVLYPRFKQPLARETRYPHNIFVHLWVELGLAGLVIWLAWVGTVGARAIRRRRHAQSPSLRTATLVLLVAAGVFVFNNMFEMTWAFREASLDWCLILGILAGLSSPAASPTATAEIASGKPQTANRGALAIAVAPPLLGVVLANGYLFCPLMAESHQQSASDLLTYAWPQETTPEEILGYAHKMIRYQPDNPWYHGWLGSFYRDVGNIDLARAEYEKALSLHPDSATLRADLARLEEEAGNLARARELLREAVDLYPRNARYHYRLAALEREAGNPDAARRHIEDALEHVLDEREKPKYEQFLQDLQTTATSPIPTAPLPSEQED